MGVVVNEYETKQIMSSNKGSQRLADHVTVDSYNFEIVKDFVYLGSSINTNNDVSHEINRGITLAI